MTDRYETDRHDFGPAARLMAALLEGVGENQLDAPTPCAEYSVRDLLTHIQNLSIAFRQAADKVRTGPPGDQPLTEDWRDGITVRLTELAEAWREPPAWEGVTEIAGLELPAKLVGTIGLNELLLHGWDLAVATGQPFQPDEASVRASVEFTSLVNSPEWTAGRAGLFTDPVEVPADASPLHRTLGLSGRDPQWRPTV